MGLSPAGSAAKVFSSSHFFCHFGSMAPKSYFIDNSLSFVSAGDRQVLSIIHEISKLCKVKAAARGIFLQIGLSWERD